MNTLKKKSQQVLKQWHYVLILAVCSNTNRWCCRCCWTSIVYTCSSPTGACRCCCHRIVYICSSPTGACRCCCRHNFLQQLRRWCSQMLPPPQSLHLLFCLKRLQRPLPLQSLHVLLTLWCSQILLPPQSLHLLEHVQRLRRHQPLRAPAGEE